MGVVQTKLLTLFTDDHFVIICIIIHLYNMVSLKINRSVTMDLCNDHKIRSIVNKPAIHLYLMM